VEIFVPLGELVDVGKERARLGKELASLEKEIERSEGRLANEGFVAKAPARVVDEERGKLAKYKDMAAKVAEGLARLG
jgi:valyl-tRNA synthetase